MCGSKVEMDSTGAIEPYGYQIQTISIECPNPKCFMELSLTCDHSYVDDSWNSLIKMWNALTKK